MKYELINKNQMIVRLTSEEMIKLGLVYATANKDDDYTMNIISKLLIDGKKETNFKSNQSKMSIEIKQNSEQNYQICFTVLPSYKLEGDDVILELSPMIFEFTDLNALINAVIAVFNNCCQLVYRSTLFNVKRKFYLAIISTNDMEEIIPSILLEYGNIYAQGELMLLHMKEYSNIIIENNAIEKLYCYFSDKQQRL